MAEQKSKKAGEIQATVKTNGDEKINFEPIKQIESDTFESVKGIKTLDYIIIALLIYLVFMLLPDIQEKVEWVEKDLNSVLVQSERYKAATRVFFKRQRMCRMSFRPRLFNIWLTKSISQFC